MLISAVNVGGILKEEGEIWKKNLEDAFMQNKGSANRRYWLIKRIVSVVFHRRVAQRFTELKNKK